MLNEVLMDFALTQYGSEEGIAQIRQHLHSDRLLKNSRVAIRTTFKCEHWDDRGERHACGINSIELL